MATRPGDARDGGTPIAGTTVLIVGGIRLARVRAPRVVAVTLVLALGLVGGVTILGTRRVRPAGLGQERFRQVPVVYLILDELPIGSLMTLRGRVDRAMFPNFAALARDSTWYRNTTTVANFTTDAVPALLTGRYPDWGRPPEVDEEARTIFTMLGREYRVRSNDHMPDLCPPTMCTGEYRHSRPSEAGEELGLFAAGSRGIEFQGFLDLIEPGRGARSPFFFSHLVLPHSPWRFLPSGQRYDETEPIPGWVDIAGPGGGWVADRWLVEQAFQRHLLQTRLADRLLGEVVERLRAAGMYEDALIVVTADHGIGFLPGGPKRQVTPDSVGHIAYVPLFVKLPRQRAGRISDLPAQTVDVVPTIIDALQLSNTWPGLDGSSLLDPIPANRERRLGRESLGPDGRGVFSLVRQKYATFSRSPSGALDLFRLGPGRSDELVGRSVAELSVATRSALRIEVGGVSDLARLKPDADPFPALLEATLQDGIGRRRRHVLAIAVDARVTSVARSYLSGGRERIAFMLPPRAFDDPPHALEFYLVADVTGEEVAPVPVEPGP